MKVVAVDFWGSHEIYMTYEVRTLQSECHVRVRYGSDTDTCKILVRHVSDTPMPCQILNNHKTTCLRRVQRRVGIK